MSMQFSFFKIAKWLLLLTPFTVVIVTTSTLFPFIVGKYVFFRTAVTLAVVLFALGIFFAPEEANKYLLRLKRQLAQPLVVAVTVFVLAFVVAGLLGVNPSNSFFSNFERGEGSLQMLLLLAYFLLLLTLFRKKHEWRIFATLTAIAALGMILYGVGAGLTYIDAETVAVPTQGGQTAERLTGQGGTLYNLFEGFVGPSFAQENYRFQGSLGNAAYVAAYLTFVIFFTSWLLLSAQAKKQKIIIFSFLAVFVVFFLLAATRGAFLGAMAGVGVFLLMLGFSYRRWRRWTAILLLVAVAGVGLLVAFNNHPAVEALPFSRVFDISITAKTLQDRVIMWGIAWEAWQDRPWFGYGPENFIYTFDRYFDPAYYTPGQQFGAWFDRAHNIFFNYLVTTGVVGLAAFIGMFVAVYQLLFTADRAKSLRKKVEMSLFVALPAAYLVQGAVLFDVLLIYMGLFAFLALAQWRYGGAQQNQKIT